LSRVINPESAGKERTQLLRGVVLALRELMRQVEPNLEARDLVAFIALSLDAIYSTIDQSVVAWEKRDYWVKADRFRMEWIWTQSTAKTLRKALKDENWATIAQSVATIGTRLGSVKVPQRHRLGTPWVGAFEKLNGESG
jgi:hypothetical protein